MFTNSGVTRLLIDVTNNGASPYAAETVDIIDLKMRGRRFYCLGDSSPVLCSTDFGYAYVQLKKESFATFADMPL